MSETVESTEKSFAVESTEKSFAVIIRGRMPIAAVALVKSMAAEEGNTNAILAAKFNTTVGKIHDIKGGRCFGYVDDSFKPTADQVTDAINWLGRHKDGAEAVADLVEALQAMDVASAEEAEAFVTKRAGTRKAAEPKIDPETGEPVKRKGRAKKEKAPVAEVADAGDDDSSVDDLLS